MITDTTALPHAPRSPLPGRAPSRARGAASCSYLKFSAVLGTTSANSSIFMRPTSCTKSGGSARSAPLPPAPAQLPAAATPPREVTQPPGHPRGRGTARREQRVESGCSLMVRSAQRRGARGRAPRRPAAPAAHLPADGDIEEHYGVVGVGRQRRHDGRLTRKRKRREAGLRALERAEAAVRVTSSRSVRHVRALRCRRSAVCPGSRGAGCGCRGSAGSGGGAPGGC